MISKKFRLKIVATIYFGKIIALTNSERVIKNYQDVVTGVPLDYRYNESSSTSSPGMINGSVPGCPKNEEGIPWVYYGTPPNAKCYLAGEKGPCSSSNQRLFIEEGNSIGFCNCKCFLGTKKGEGPQFCKEGKDLEYVFVPEEKMCYQIYEQGFCQSETQWLTKSEASPKKVECEERKCPSKQIPTSYTEEELKKDPKLRPCRNPIIIAESFSGSINPNDCKNAGMKYSKLLKKCVPNSDGYNFGR